MADRQTRDDSSFTLDASNAPAYERRQRERQVQQDADLEKKPRKRVIEREVWWVIAAYVMMGTAFVTVLLVK